MSEKIKVKSGTAADIIAGLDIDDETIERAKKYVDKVKHINDSSNLITELVSKGRVYHIQDIIALGGVLSV